MNADLSRLPTGRGRPATTTAALTALAVLLVAEFSLVSFVPRARAAQSFADRIDIKGYLQESIAGRRTELDDVIFHRQTFNTEVEIEAGDDLDLNFEVDLWRDDPDFLGRDTFRSRVREAYAKFGFDAFDLRIGRFQVAWGQSDALIISDQITPFVLSSFYVRLQEKSRCRRTRRKGRRWFH